jgi:hypothetical protein
MMEMGLTVGAIGYRLGGRRSTSKLGLARNLVY